MKRLVILVVALGLSSGGGFAQLALPGAADSNAPAADAPAAEVAPKPAKRHHLRRAAPAPAGVDAETVVGKSLRLNGRAGELQLARGDGKSLRIIRYTLLGEVVSHPTQQCRINIVSEQPIEAAPLGEPDGLPRFTADIPACPLTFDLVDGGVVAPPQGNACVFTAADCQASPSGVWGPPAAELDKDPKAISKVRAAADRSIQDSLRELEKRDKDAAASLAREENDFAAERDDVCHDYDGETRLGFCASRLSQTRAALLAKRVSETGSSQQSSAEHKRRRRKTP